MYGGSTSNVSTERGGRACQSGGWPSALLTLLEVSILYSAEFTSLRVDFKALASACAARPGPLLCGAARRCARMRAASGAPAAAGSPCDRAAAAAGAAGLLRSLQACLASPLHWRRQQGSAMHATSLCAMGRPRLHL